MDHRITIGWATTEREPTTLGYHEGALDFTSMEVAGTPKSPGMAKKEGGLSRSSSMGHSLEASMGGKGRGSREEEYQMLWKQVSQDGCWRRPDWGTPPQPPPGCVPLLCLITPSPQAGTFEGLVSDGDSEGQTSVEEETRVRMRMVRTAGHASGHLA